jgi:hypothetical protein
VFQVLNLDDGGFFQPHDDGLRQRCDRRYAPRLPGQTSFTEEVVRSQNCDDGFLALLRTRGWLFLERVGIMTLATSLLGEREGAEYHCGNRGSHTDKGDNSPPSALEFRYLTFLRKQANNGSRCFSTRCSDPLW